MPETLNEAVGLATVVTVKMPGAPTLNVAVAALVNVIVRAAEAPKGAAEAEGLARALRASARGRYRVPM